MIRTIRTFAPATKACACHGGLGDVQPDAVLGPVDPITGQYTSVYGANPGTTTPIFYQAPSGYEPPAPAQTAGFSLDWKSLNWGYVAATAAVTLLLIRELDRPQGRRRR